MRKFHRVLSGFSARVGFILAACAGLVVLFYSRIHYAPKYLFYFDNANFAFALRHFDPSKHQPQPPGYPMFVALLHIINVFTQDPHRAQLAAGLLGSATALVLLWYWTKEMFGDTPAYIAAGLLLLHPVFWLAGVANPVRVFLAVIQIATSIAAWKTATSVSPARAFYFTAIVLGLTAGFRPETLVLLIPLWISVGAYRKLKAKSFLIGWFVLAASSAVWLIPMAARMGGFAAMFVMFSDYLRSNSVEFTMAYGAPPERSFATARKALIWTFGMCVVWVWALPFVWRRFRTSWNVPKFLLMLAALLPAVLFHSLIHVRDVDQTLISVPITCAVGGLVLASLPGRIPVGVAVCLALAASYWSFRRPFFPELAGASGRAIRYVDDWTRSTYDALNQVRHEPGLVLVWHSIVVPYRNVSYYYPDLPLLVTNQGSPFWAGRESTARSGLEPDGTVVVYSAKHVILGLSYEEASAAEHQLWNARRIGPLIELSPAGEQRLELRTLRLLLKP